MKSMLRRGGSSSSSSSDEGNGIRRQPSVVDLDLADQQGLPHHHTSRRGLINKVQLSTYGDCIGDNMKDLNSFIKRHLGDAVGSIHMLPCYPSSADRGFAPISYKEIDPEQGSWEDLQGLAKEYELMVELMVNHISPESEEFQDYVKRGDDSPYADMFVRWDRLWGPGRPTPKDLEKIRTRKPEPPLLQVEMKDGSKVPLWCTFSPQQIDINPFSEAGWAFIEQSLKSLCEKGARMIRLDAFGYVTKKPGTPCFMESPEVWELLEKLKAVAEPYGTQLLCEVHENYASNLELARRGYWSYDFSLPLLLLHALNNGRAAALRRWMRICPRRQVTVLDTHDGMGIDDIKGLAPVVDVFGLQRTIEQSLGCSPNHKFIYKPYEDTDPYRPDPTWTEKGSGFERSTGDGLHVKPGGVYHAQPHQYNCTYFSACHRDPAAYLLARAIQFFTPGVPMVYYIGLLAGVNDNEGAKKSGSGRDINRHRYSVKEAEEAVKQPVVQDLLALCRFRNSFPAFQGTFSLDDAADAARGSGSSSNDSSGRRDKNPDGAGAADGAHSNGSSDHQTPGANGAAAAGSNGSSGSNGSNGSSHGHVDGSGAANEAGGNGSSHHKKHSSKHSHKHSKGSNHRDFDGQGVYGDSAHVLRVGWQLGCYACQLTADLQSKQFEIRYTTDFGVAPHTNNDAAASTEAEQNLQQQEAALGSRMHIYPQAPHSGKVVHIEEAIKESKAAAEQEVPAFDSNPGSCVEASGLHGNEPADEAVEARKMEGQMGSVQNGAGKPGQQLGAALSGGKGHDNESDAPDGGRGNSGAEGAEGGKAAEGGEGADCEMPSIRAATADTARWKLLDLPSVANDKIDAPEGGHGPGAVVVQQ